MTGSQVVIWAGGQGPTFGAPRAIAFAVLLILATFVSTAGFILGDQSRDDDRSWMLWEAAAWLMLGVAIAVVSIVAAFWYVVASAGLALAYVGLWGLAQLVQLAIESPLPGGLGGAGAGLICLAGAVLGGVDGRPRLALLAFGAATLLTGLAALLVVAEGRSQLKPRQAMIVAAAGTAVPAACGLALLVLGPLIALNTSGSVALRAVGGAVSAIVGGLGICLAGAVLAIYRKAYGGAAGLTGGDASEQTGGHPPRRE